MHEHREQPSDWDERYASAEQMWSGRPNPALVTEVSDLTPGRAADVGCGEGADAIWLASNGWDVTALDVSQVALERAAAAAVRANVDIRWIHAGLLDADLEPDAYDLVTAHYPVLLRSDTADAEHTLMRAVAPGGHLLVVHHVLDATAIEHSKANGFDPADYVSPGDVASLLDDAWIFAFEESRPRPDADGTSHHTHDIVLHAQRVR